MTDSVTYARPYAEAAHKIAKETKSTKTWLENLTILSSTIKDAQVKAILASPSVGDNQKISFLEEMISKKSEDFTKFLEILLDNKKIYFVDSIADLFQEMVLADDEISIATVETAYLLSDEQKDKLTKKLQKQHSKKILIEELVNKSLIAGIKIHVNNQVIDHSIKFRINAMREQIKER